MWICFTILVVENFIDGCFLFLQEKIDITKEGIIIDTTGLPNQINMDINEWGYIDKIEEEIKFLFVVAKGKGLPLFFSIYPGI
ncbi:MAG TPA: hypothetical protein PLW95_03500 [bacterium]|nr:hypothetical protein [bacterium]